MIVSESVLLQLPRPFSFAMLSLIWSVSRIQFLFKQQLNLFKNFCVMLMKAFIILSLKQNIRFTRATNVNFCKSFFPGPMIKVRKVDDGEMCCDGTYPIYLLEQSLVNEWTNRERGSRCVSVFMFIWRVDCRCLLDDDEGEQNDRRDDDEKWKKEMLNKSQPLGNKVKAEEMCLFVYFL